MLIAVGCYVSKHYFLIRYFGCSSVEIGSNVRCFMAERVLAILIYRIDLNDIISELFSFRWYSFSRASLTSRARTNT